MSLEGFTSEIRNYKKLDITEKETYYLFLILLGYDTAYKIFSDLRRDNPISYKNVHERVVKLSDLKLIQNLGVKAKRGAIVYEVTSMGVFHLLKNVPILSPFLVRYRKDIILQYLLFQFFDPKTIRYFEPVHSSMSLKEYLSTTCSEILETLENFRSSKEKDKYKALTYQIEVIVRKNISKFVYMIVTSYSIKDFTLVIHSKKKIREIHYNIEQFLPEGTTDSNFSTFFPFKSLKEDRKFIYLLKQIKQEFDEGYQQLIP